MRNIVYRIRLYHATLAILSGLAYISGEVEFVHAYLGYAVALIIVFRLMWALSGHRQLGLMRFYPDFEGLNTGNMFTHPSISKSLLLGIAVSVILTTLTGILMDEGKTIGLSSVALMDKAYADDDKHSEGNEFLEESHEFFANVMFLFVAGHIAYLLVFKFPLARFMLFFRETRSRE